MASNTPLIGCKTELVAILWEICTLESRERQFPAEAHQVGVTTNEYVATHQSSYRYGQFCSRRLRATFGVTGRIADRGTIS
jgi:hypothetical protein